MIGLNGQCVDLFQDDNKNMCTLLCVYHMCVKVIELFRQCGICCFSSDYKI